jgi:hypothetical protein
LPVVSDTSGELDDAAILRQLDVAHHGDAPARERIDREQGFMDMVVDVHQAVEFALVEDSGTGEPKVPRVIGKTPDRSFEQRPIAALEGSDGDDASVTERQKFGWHSGRVTRPGTRSHPSFPSHAVRA